MGFNILGGLINHIRPATGEMNRAEIHAAQIRGSLQGNLDLTAFRRIGSHSRGSAIRSHSDLDYLAVSRVADMKWGDSLVRSSTALERVRSALITRYPYTDLRRDGQAVAIRFSDSISVDVVPAVFAGMHESHASYWIPDGGGGWILSAPDGHNKYLAQSDRRSGGKLSRTAMILKEWRHSFNHPMPLSSFYLELVLAESQICEGARPYTECVAEAFKVLSDHECAPVTDPLGVSDGISACQTDAQRDRALDAVARASERAMAALAAEYDGKLQKAADKWSVIFNRAWSFP